MSGTLVLLDTCVWFALLNPKDSKHVAAKKSTKALDHLRVIIPWPILYETINTDFVRKPAAMRPFEVVLGRTSTCKLSDAPYRDEAMRLAFVSARDEKRHISLVDWVIRLMLRDTGVRVQAFWTYNPGDFSDVCRERAIPLIQPGIAPRGPAA